MREKLKNKKLLLSLCFACLCLALLLPVNSQAASAKSKAMKAYRKLLSGTTISWGDSAFKVPLKNCSFAIAYIDNNSVPELIIYNDIDTFHASGYGMLYTYQNGKAKLVEPLSMNTKFYYYKKKGIFIDNYTGSGVGVNSYMRLSKGKAATKLVRNVEYSVIGSTSRQTYSQPVNENYKQISKSQYNRLLKKLVGTRKKSGITLRANTKANRTKYLK